MASGGSRLLLLLGCLLLLVWLALQARSLLSVASLWQGMTGGLLLVLAGLWLVQLVRVGPGALADGPWVRRLLATLLLAILSLECFEALKLRLSKVPQLTLAPLTIAAELEPNGRAALQDQWLQRLQRVRHWQTLPAAADPAHKHLQARLSRMDADAPWELALALPGALGTTRTTVVRADNWPALQEQAVTALAALISSQPPSVEPLSHELATLTQIKRCQSSDADRDQALSELRQAVALAPASALAQAALGECLLARTGADVMMPLADQHEARAALNRALHLAPELPTAARDRARLGLLLGEASEQTRERFALLQLRYPYWPAVDPARSEPEPVTQ